MRTLIFLLAGATVGAVAQYGGSYFDDDYYTLSARGFYGDLDEDLVARDFDEEADSITLAIRDLADSFDISHDDAFMYLAARTAGGIMGVPLKSNAGSLAQKAGQAIQQGSSSMGQRAGGGFKRPGSPSRSGQRSSSKGRTPSAPKMSAPPKLGGGSVVMKALGGNNEFRN